MLSDHWTAHHDFEAAVQAAKFGSGSDGGFGTWTPTGRPLEFETCDAFIKRSHAPRAMLLKLPQQVILLFNQPLQPVLSSPLLVRSQA